MRLNCESDIRYRTHKHISATPLWEVLLFLHLADYWCACVRACILLGYLFFKPRTQLQMIGLHAMCVCMSQTSFTLSIGMPHTHTSTFTSPYVIPSFYQPMAMQVVMSTPGHMHAAEYITSIVHYWCSWSQQVTLDSTGVTEQSLGSVTHSPFSMYTYLYNYTHMHTVVLVFVQCMYIILLFQQYEYNTNNVMLASAYKST